MHVNLFQATKMQPIMIKEKKQHCASLQTLEATFCQASLFLWIFHINFE